MIKTNEQFAAANKAAIDSMMTIANTSLANVERLAALNLNTARAFFTDAVAGFGMLATVKDTQELVALQSALAKPALEKAITYSRTVFEILNDSASGMTQLVEGQTAEMKKTFSAAVEQSLRNAPAGSETVVAAVKSVMAQADTAYETLSKSSRQAKAMIETTMASANAATVKLMKVA